MVARTMARLLACHSSTMVRRQLLGRRRRSTACHRGATGERLTSARAQWQHPDLSSDGGATICSDGSAGRRPRHRDPRRRRRRVHAVRRPAGKRLVALVRAPLRPSPAALLAAGLALIAAGLSLWIKRPSSHSGPLLALAAGFAWFAPELTNPERRIRARVHGGARARGHLPGTRRPRGARLPDRPAPLGCRAGGRRAPLRGRPRTGTRPPCSPKAAAAARRTFCCVPTARPAADTMTQARSRPRRRRLACRGDPVPPATGDNGVAAPPRSVGRRSLPGVRGSSRRSVPRPVLPLERHARAPALARAGAGSGRPGRRRRLEWSSYGPAEHARRSRGSWSSSRSLRLRAASATCSPASWAIPASSSPIRSRSPNRLVDADGRPVEPPGRATAHDPRPRRPARRRCGARARRARGRAARRGGDGRRSPGARERAPAGRGAGAAGRARASRARIVEAGDAERRRLERDLHDGAQQRLVGLSLSLRLLRVAPPGATARARRRRAAPRDRRAPRAGTASSPPCSRTKASPAAVEALAEESRVPLRLGALAEGASRRRSSRPLTRSSAKSCGVRRTGRPSTCERAKPARALAVDLETAAADGIDVVALEDRSVRSTGCCRSTVATTAMFVSTRSCRARRDRRRRDAPARGRRAAARGRRHRGRRQGCDADELLGRRARAS